jgi:hypothetical protein
MLGYESGGPIIEQAMVAPLIQYYLLSASNFTTLSVSTLLSVQRWDDSRVMNWEGFGMKTQYPNRGIIPVFA